ncbi:small G protein signaling modulator 2-like isoform X3 [Zootermopsis nevadensis]|uniref:small G protein signaling modulator 2-like isoform X3 n=1 Tax=Zootermopsis nevadensis TaxID=136037 RepID=UPI000B8E8876|nr:small G protein signaling modulator 2-like isoform X3 [Zootermopsis nevadensis]
MAALCTDSDFKEKLIRNVKKEVKQIMEEAVTRKFVHEESSSITSLCGAVEACLSQGLKRRALGLFKTSSTTALLHKVAKIFEPAAIISRKIQEIENSDPNRRSSSSGDSTNRPPVTGKPPLQKKNSAGGVMTPAGPPSPRYLWIRLALFEKQLAIIIDYLVQNSSKYYEKDSLVADSDFGSILSSLLVGPCALDYSKTKTQDHFWTDPPADELVQRHRISSGHATPPSCRRPALNFRRSLHAVSSEEGNRHIPLSAKDYVESLHQNSRATLLYGKNNVLVLPKDMTEPMPGYLSLHQTAHLLTIKWTPNQLMNGYSETEIQDKSLYWDYAMNVQVDEIVYVHCHQQADSGGTIVLVGQDGVQRPPIHFPKGGHLLAFLSCLENGLLPHGQLDPPLWSQRGKGKVFPKLRRKGRTLTSLKNGEDAEDETTDYVFRIVSKVRHEDFLTGQDLMYPSPLTSSVQQLQSKVRAQLISTSTASSTSSSKSLSLDPGSGAEMPESPRQGALSSGQNPKLTTGDSIQLVCETMKRQIISRAFYGWLAYCRHLTTVRTHLSGLVNQRIVTQDDPCDASEGLTREKWDKMNVDGIITDKAEVFRLTYYGGICHELRKQLWPYLLGHYQFGSSPEGRQELDLATQQSYETTMSEWLAVEAIVRQRDKETMAANLAKLSSESTSGDVPPPTPAMAQELSNDVFEDNLSLLSDENDSVDEEETTNHNGKTEYGDQEEEYFVRCPPNSLENNQTDVEEQQFPAECSSSPSDCGKNGHPNSKSSAEKQNGIHMKLNGTCDDRIRKGEQILNGIVEEDETTTIPCSQSSKENHSPDKHFSNTLAESVSKLVNGYTSQILEENYQEIKSSSPDEGVVEDEDVETKINNGHAGNKQSVQKKTQKSRSSHKGQAPSAAVIVTTNPSVDSGNQSDPYVEQSCDRVLTPHDEEKEGLDTLAVTEETAEGNSQGCRSTCISPASSQGGVYSMELLEIFGLNLHRIDKDVQRCDRNYWYFTTENLDKLRNVMCTYVWEHLDVGYMQGMCDLVAPLLVIFDDEGTTYSCFCHLMERMGSNFPNGGTMDIHFANMRSLIQILDSEMFELMHQNGDYTHFYFCYRWFLLDFKRELLYEDVFSMWETIWAAKHMASSHFVLFIALALVESYRDIILNNSMDFTDIIKFFNEMAERHDAKAILSLARELVLQLQTLIENT